MHHQIYYMKSIFNIFLVNECDKCIDGGVLQGWRWNCLRQSCSRPLPAAPAPDSPDSPDSPGPEKLGCVAGAKPTNSSGATWQCWPSYISCADKRQVRPIKPVSTSNSRWCSHVRAGLSVTKLNSALGGKMSSSTREKTARTYVPLTSMATWWPQR